jgi:hypothetical protein
VVQDCFSRVACPAKRWVVYSVGGRHLGDTRNASDV